MTAAAHTGIHAHRTRGGRWDFVTVEHEPGNVVRLLGIYPTRTDAQRSLTGRAGVRRGPLGLALRVAGQLGGVMRSRLTATTGQSASSSTR